MTTIYKLNGNLPSVIAMLGDELETEVFEACHLALLQLGDEVYNIEWANKYAALSVQEIKLAA